MLINIILEILQGIVTTSFWAFIEGVVHRVTFDYLGVNLDRAGRVRHADEIAAALVVKIGLWALTIGRVGTNILWLGAAYAKSTGAENKVGFIFRVLIIELENSNGAILRQWAIV